MRDPSPERGGGTARSAVGGAGSSRTYWFRSNKSVNPEALEEGSNREAVLGRGQTLDARSNFRRRCPPPESCCACRPINFRPPLKWEVRRVPVSCPRILRILAFEDLCIPWRPSGAPGSAEKKYVDSNQTHHALTGSAAGAATRALPIFGISGRPAGAGCAPPRSGVRRAY
jgi:hypothetical protein